MVMQYRASKTARLFICLVGIFCIIVAQSAMADQSGDFYELQVARTILERDNELHDLAEIKLSIDQLIDPTIDINAALHTLDRMVADIQLMVSDDATDMEKMLALRAYLYVKGPWNHQQVYQYDFDDPLGTNIANKLLPRYLATRRGNCVSMPLLFLILGQRLGLNVTASLAPLHIFVKFTDSNGTVYNLETTNGAHITRDVWYREQMLITDQAIRNHIYLHPLSHKETVVVMISVLAEHFSQQHEPRKAMGIADLSLQHYPNYAEAMVRMGSTFYWVLHDEFLTKYPTPRAIPPERRQLFQFLSEGNQYWFARAEALGWREPPKESDERYLKQVQEMQQHGGK